MSDTRTTGPTREEILAHARARIEEPDTPAMVSHRAEIITRMRRIAKLAPSDSSSAADGAVLLLGEMDPTAEDHVALAIAAHRLLRRAVLQDIESVGHTEDEWPRLLHLLVDYLEDCGWWAAEGGHFANVDHPRHVAAILSRS